MDLSVHIKSLLEEHDCVVVPDFGGFIANLEPAKLDVQKHTVYPPSRVVSFNKNLNSNDGLLVQDVRQELSVDYASASSVVRDVVLTWKQQLKDSGRIVIDGVGAIYLDKDQKWRFSGDQVPNLFSYGMPTIALKAIVIEKKGNEDQEEETKIVPIVVKDNQSVSGRKKVVRYAVLVACIAPLAFYSYWIPSQTSAVDRGYVTLADFNPFSNSAPKDNITAYKTRQLSDDLKAQTFEHTIEPLSDAVSISGREFTIVEPLLVSKESNVSTETVSEINQVPQGDYHLIAGCFSKESNATKQVNLFKEAGFNSYVLDVKGGLHRVCVQSYSSALDAKTAKNKVFDMGKSAWVLKQ